MSYKVEETDKEIELREIERRLVNKYTPEVFQDSLEGRTINMKPVDIILDETVLKCNYPKPATVSQNVPINYTKAAYDLIQKNLKEGVIAPVDIPTDFCACATFVPKADGVSWRLVTDFRGLTKIIKRPVWPFSPTENIIARMDPRKQWIASIDMLSG